MADGALQMREPLTPEKGGGPYPKVAPAGAGGGESRAGTSLAEAGYLWARKEPSAPSATAAKRDDVGLEHLGPGMPLPPPVREFFEPRFQHDFSRVRIHADGEAEKRALGVRAQAFTLGSHVVFARDGWAPESGPGRRLLAHELAHVVQADRREGEIDGHIFREEGSPTEQTSGFVTEESSEATGASGVVAPETPNEETLHGETYRYHLQEGIRKLEGAASKATNGLFGRTVEGYCQSLEGTLLERFVPFASMVWLPIVTRTGFDAQYWRYEIDCMTSKVQLLQKAGKPSEAVDEMFAHLGQWTFDCAEYLQVAQWYAQRHTMGADAFGAKMTSLGGLTLRQHGSIGIVTSDLYFRAGPSEPFGRDNKIAQRSESTSLTEDEILAAAPVGTRVTWSNVAAPRSGEEGREWWSFGNENTLKMGENSYAAHPFGTVRREDIECRLAASGYVRELEEIGLLPEFQTRMIRATLRRECEEGRPGEFLRDYMGKKIFISYIEFFKIE